jgi:hypothetical protein
MGVFGSTIFSNGDLNERASLLANYLNQLDGITAETETITVGSNSYTGVKFTIDEINVTGFLGYNSGCTDTAAYVKNNNTDTYLYNPTVSGNNYQRWSNVKIYYYLDDNIKLINVGDVMNGYRFKVELMLVTTTTSTKLVGYRVEASGTDTFFDISTLTFEDSSSDSRAAYTYTNMFPYYALPGTIDFVASGFFTNNNGFKKYICESMRECSTVGLLSTQALFLGSHLAIGTHCLVPIDEEE